MPASTNGTYDGDPGVPASTYGTYTDAASAAGSRVAFTIEEVRERCRVGE